VSRYGARVKEGNGKKSKGQRQDWEEETGRYGDGRAPPPSVSALRSASDGGHDNDTLFFSSNVK